MIKKFTPSKNFSKEKRESNCCTFWQSNEANEEKTLDITPRQIPLDLPRTPIKLASRVDPNPDNASSFSNTSLHTPGTSLFPSQVYSKTQPQTAATFEHSPCTDPFPDLRLSYRNPNPLTRLRQRLFRNVSARDHAQSSFQSGRITFNYISGQTGLRSQGAVSHGNLLGERSEQLQEKLEEGLKRQIEEYRAEYKQLLQEYARLREEKESNAEHYSRLLERIKAKEEEIRELERLRREEVRALREELEQFIKGQQEERDEE